MLASFSQWSNYNRDIHYDDAMLKKYSFRLPGNPLHIACNNRGFGQDDVYDSDW